MYSSKVCRGIFATAGRAVFVWIEPVDATRGQRNKRPRVESKKIYVTEELFVDHADFLRVVASFLVESVQIDLESGMAAANLLNVPSEEGGFQLGRTQKHTPTENTQDEDYRNARKKKKAATSSGNTKGKGKTKSAESTFVEAIPHLSKVPDFTVESTIATTLGRERQGTVIGAKWNGVPIAVKMVNTDGDDREYACNLFHTEVEAYKKAGAAGLWGESVPRPLFTVETDTLCALGMVQGVSMPLDPLDWTAQDRHQAKEAVQRLQQSGITLTDIKPANFVKLNGSGTNGGMEETGQRVVAIDLEGFSSDDIEVELPPWLFREGTPVLIANDSCS